MGQLDGKVAIITGTARGIGQALARAFVANGAKLVMTDILDSGAAVAAELGEAALFLQHDVSESAQWAKVVDTTLSKFGKLDILVNNGAQNISKPFMEATQADMERCFRVNALGVMFGMQACFAALKKSGKGSIVNVVSGATVRTVPNVFPYATSKWAARGVSACAAVELGREGIRVNAVHPGIVETKLLLDNNPPEVIERIVSNTPIGRIGQPVDVAELVMFLASDAASYLNGSDIVIDGGVMM